MTIIRATRWALLLAIACAGSTWAAVDPPSPPASTNPFALPPPMPAPPLPSGLPKVLPNGEACIPAVISRPPLAAVQTAVARIRPLVDPETGALTPQFNSPATVALVIDEDGVPLDYGIAESTGDRNLDRLIIEHAKDSRFRPMPGCGVMSGLVPYDLHY